MNETVSLPIHIDITPIIPDFEQDINELWKDSDKTQLLERLAKTATTIKDTCLAIGAQSNHFLLHGDAPSAEQVVHYKTVFQWLQEAKYFMMGWRDVTFEQYKALVLLADNKIQPQALEQFSVDSQKVLLEAQAELVEHLNTYHEKSTIISGDTKQQLRVWSNAQNPYALYQEQIEGLANQCANCQVQLPILLKEKTVFQQITVAILENITQIKAQLNQLQTVLSTLILNDLADTAQLDTNQQLSIILEKEQAINFDNLQMTFNTNLEQFFDQISTKLDVPISANAGMMVNRDVPLQRQVRRWVLAEIKPLLYEIWEIRDNLTTGGKMILMNLKNQLNILIAQQEQPTEFGQTLSSTITVSTTFLEQLKRQVGELNQLEKQVANRLNSEFRLSNIFNTQKEFLPLKSQAAFNQVIFNQSDVFIQVQKWWNTQRQKLQNYQSSLEYKEGLSTSEQVIQYIEYRKSGGNNEYYQNIFLTKGYVGEAFWAGRKDELRRIGQVIENWQLGYRGTVLLSGKRTAGKSLFGEVIANRYFRNKTTHLFPNAQLKVEGQNIQTTYDLDKALHQIKRQIGNGTHLIWIDNLEMWWDVNTSLNTNIRKLKRFMDMHGQQLFFMIATSDIFKNHLTLTHDIEGLFQATIEMGDFPVQHLEETISIRHGATHKTLVNAQGESLSPQAFSKIVRKIHKATHGNLGMSLQLWCNSIKVLEDNKMQCTFENPPIFPDFLNANTATLLTSIALQKRTTEYLLRHLFGPAYNQKYAGLVKRLLSIGILTKRINGWLEINELVVHEVIDRLHRKKYLI